MPQLTRALVIRLVIAIFIAIVIGVILTQVIGFRQPTATMGILIAIATITTLYSNKK